LRVPVRDEPQPHAPENDNAINFFHKNALN
jgi:hypothetical protein